MPIAADRTLKYLLRCVLFFCAVGDFTLRVKCISGRSNTFLATICRSTSRRFPGHTHIPCQFSTPCGICLRASGLNGSHRGTSDLISSCLVPNSYWTYQSGQSEYLQFCVRLGIRSLPAEEPVLILFVAHLSLHLTHSSVRSDTCTLSMVLIHR